MGWQAHSNSIVDKCLNGGGRSGKLIWLEDFTIGVTDEGKLGVNLFKNSARSAAQNCTIQAEFIGGLRKTMVEIVNEPKATCKFKR